MWVEFSYSGDISHLSGKERKALKKELEECTKARNWEYLDITRTQLDCGGSYDNQDGYACDHEDVECVLDKYDVEWTGGAEEFTSEPEGLSSYDIW